MAFTEFYIQTTGNDLNAGSDNNDTASVTSTGGTISTTTTTTTFTAASGTPFSGVSVGQYISLANNSTSGSADTVARFVVPVLTVVGGGSGITFYNDTATGANRVSFGAIAGVSTTAAAVDCRVGGAWASLLINNTGGALATPTATFNITPRMNIKAGTYTNGTTVITIAATNATNTKPIIFRGYNTTIGDLDNIANVNDNINRPKINFTGAGRLVITNGTWLENLEISSAGSSNTLGVVHVNGAFGYYYRIFRCRITATTYTALSISGGFMEISGSFCSAGASGSGIYIAAATKCLALGTIIKGSTGVSNNNVVNGAYACIFSYCIAIGSGKAGSNCFSGPSLINNCVAYNGNGMASPQFVINSIIANDTTGFFGINNALSVNNAFWNCTAGNYTGTNPNFEIGSIVETANPFTNAIKNDFSLIPTALSRGAGFPGQLESI